MPTIHLMCGFIGFGKTTVAKELAQKISAVRFTHDEIMLERYGRNPENFAEKYKIVDDYIRTETEKHISQNHDVILDYGFWTHEKRKEYYTWAKSLTDDVIFHVLKCDIDIAKNRTLKRTQTDQNALLIDEKTFDTLLENYEPFDCEDNYPVVLHNAANNEYIGKIVHINIDRPKASKHPEFNFEYPINYGYVPYTKSEDNEELDAYVLAVNEPLKEYTGSCIGVIHRTDDSDDKLIIVPRFVNLSNEEIEHQTAFQEKWFKHILVRNSNITKTHFGVYGIIRRNDKILLIKKARGPYTGLYDLPGGGQEKDESYLDTLKREIAEETGCDVIKAENERHNSIIFSDFTIASNETGILQHDAVLFDVQIKGDPKSEGDGLDSAGAVWIKTTDLNTQNATPYALMGAKKI